MDWSLAALAALSSLGNYFSSKGSDDVKRDLSREEMAWRTGESEKERASQLAMLQQRLGMESGIAAAQNELEKKKLLADTYGGAATGAVQAGSLPIMSLARMVDSIQRGIGRNNV